MGATAGDGNGQVSAGAGSVPLEPQAVIDRLLAQIAQLSYTVALKDAYIADLEAREVGPAEPREVTEDARA